MPRHRLVIWDKENGYGAEFAEVDLAADRLSAADIAIGLDPLPYRLEFTSRRARAGSRHGST